MIDIHNHTLFGVDDGPKEIQISLEMIKRAVSQGTTEIILTPHYRTGMFPYDPEKIETNYKDLRTAITEDGIDIRLYLGCEYHVDEKILDHIARGRVHTLGDGDFVLTEYSYGSDFDYMLEQTRRLRRSDYHPIIAHAERYACLEKKPKLCGELQKEGALIQCNANALLGKEGKSVQRMIWKLLKNEWIDIIASDTHDLNDRDNHMEEAFQAVKFKYGESYALKLFQENAEIIIDNCERAKARHLYGREPEAAERQDAKGNSEDNDTYSAPEFSFEDRIDLKTDEKKDEKEASDSSEKELQEWLQDILNKDSF